MYTILIRRWPYCAILTALLEFLMFRDCSRSSSCSCYGWHSCGTLFTWCWNTSQTKPQALTNHSEFWSVLSHSLTFTSLWTERSGLIRPQFSWSSKLVSNMLMITPESSINSGCWLELEFKCVSSSKAEVLIMIPRSLHSYTSCKEAISFSESLCTSTTLIALISKNQLEHYCNWTNGVWYSVLHR